MSVLEKLLNINTYVQDGFSKVADVRANPDTGKWELVEQSSSLYENHTSWVYAVVVGEEIVKIGETGLKLGIKKQRTDQPVSTPLIEWDAWQDLVIHLMQTGKKLILMLEFVQPYTKKLSRVMSVFGLNAVIF